MVQGGVSSRVHRSHDLDNFFSRHQAIFRTTRSMQGFAYSKPHGYAGDFEIIERIYSMCASHHPDVMKWDKFFHSGSASKAVRNRSDLLSSLLIDEKPTEIISVGSGPALDIVGASKLFQNNPNVNFVDNDLNALSRAKVNMLLCQDACGTTTYNHKNALRFRPSQKFDFIWSSGLFDYLNDKTAVFLLKRLKDLLNNRSVVAIGNFSHENPSRSYMELVGEWFLIHRSKEDLMNIAISAGFNGRNLELIEDETGLNIFLIARNG